MIVGDGLWETPFAEMGLNFATNRRTFVSCTSQFESYTSQEICKDQITLNDLSEWRRQAFKRPPSFALLKGFTIPKKPPRSENFSQWKKSMTETQRQKVIMSERKEGNWEVQEIQMPNRTHTWRKEPHPAKKSSQQQCLPQEKETQCSTIYSSKLCFMSLWISFSFHVHDF